MVENDKISERRGLGVLAWIELQRNILEALAREVADQFWKYHYESKIDAPIGEWSTYGCRVRPGSTSVKIEWRLIYYVGPKGKRKIMSKDLARGKGYAYTPRSFRKASVREMNEIMKAERIFAEIRRLNEALTKVARQVDGYNLVMQGVEARLGQKLSPQD